ncbi:thioredoxin family protein [Brevibacillus humidisoli]|uniref:thioredoxin family protein n=1 Tax=Brevibacillus humidisoli TaxID=2895522 RepID=UPI001E5AE408|nr:thioredoxin family protein [Brevibacillus humidisoli]UFJ41445.1 thioredoxin family protein [Brevibacillus humidisoli]
MVKAIFYHAGCPVCVDAEQMIFTSLDKSKFDLEVVHLGTAQERIAEAESFGVKSVPALVVGEKAYHINFGASLDDVKAGS